MAIEVAVIEARLRARLTELVDADADANSSTEPVALDQEAVGRLSRMDAMQVQAMAVAARTRRGVQRQSIEAALQRLGTDAFGKCSRCGEEIAEARLLNDPTVLHCIRCAR